MVDPTISARSGSAPARRRGAVGELRGAAAALSFLTRLPIGSAVVLDGDDLARAGPYFPLVGASLGGIVALVALGVGHFEGPLLAAVVAVAAYVGLTGALHLDAVADTVDALGCASREEALRVMREPTIGAFGATALFLDLLLWTALLATLVGRPSFLPIVVVVGAMSRLGPVLLLASLPYVRPQGGIGSALARGPTVRAAVAVAIAFALSAVWLGTGGILLVALSLIALGPLALGFQRWLGGVTGDTLGCSVEVLEIAGLSIAVALLTAGALR